MSRNVVTTMQTPLLAFASVCGFFLAIPLVAVGFVSLTDRLHRIHRRPGFEVLPAPRSADGLVPSDRAVVSVHDE